MLFILVAVSTVVSKHYEVACEHQDNENYESGAAAHSEDRENKDEKHWHDATEDHPEHVVFHDACIFLVVKILGKNAGTAALYAANSSGNCLLTAASSRLDKR